MTILVDFGISVDRFELGGFVADHALEAELERIVPTGDRVIPYVWVTGESNALDSLTESLETSGKTNSVAVLDELRIDGSEERQHLYRIEWETDDLDVIKGIVDADGAVLEGKSTNDYWRLRFRFPDHQNVAEFYQFLADNDITDFRIDSIYQLKQRSDRVSKPWTPEQREALAAAAKRGYFDVPRDASLEEVGAVLGITQQAASERVRRGVRNVVHDALNLPDARHDGG
jgi:predicted DNA binding protein